MSTVEQLTQVFNDNFGAYYRSHVAHVNIMGRNFISDHKLLQKVYEDLQGQIDTIAELLRTLNAFMPSSLQTVIVDSHMPSENLEGDSDYLLQNIKDDLQHLKDCYVELMEISDSEGHQEIANYAQDRILALGKFIWMISSTLD